MAATLARFAFGAKAGERWHRRAAPLEIAEYSSRQLAVTRVNSF